MNSSISLMLSAEAVSKLDSTDTELRKFYSVSAENGVLTENDVITMPELAILLEGIANEDEGFYGTKNLEDIVNVRFCQFFTIIMYFKI